MSGRDRLADFQGQQNQGYGGQQQGYGQQGYGQQGYGQQQQYGGNQYGQQSNYNQGYNTQQQFAQQQQQQYRPQQQQQPAHQAIPMGDLNGASAAGGDINKFFSEVTSIQEDIAKLEQNITTIEELHEASVNNVSSEDQATRVTRQLEGITADTTQLSNRIKKRIKDIELANLRLANSADIQIRRTQAAALKDKFLKSLRRYQTAESEARRKYQGRLERQYKIVKPDATPEDIRQAMESDNQQVFAQTVLQTPRYGEASRALREVQNRHDDIKKIERTILELHQLFMDMETLVTEQQEVMNKIEENTQQAEEHLQTGVQEVDSAIDNARSARKKKWICLFVLIIILIIVAVVLYLQLRPKQ